MGTWRKAGKGKRVPLITLEPLSDPGLTFSVLFIFSMVANPVSHFSSLVFNFTARKHPDPMPEKAACVMVHKKKKRLTNSKCFENSLLYSHFPYLPPPKKSWSYETHAKYWAIKLRNIERTVFLNAYFFSALLVLPRVFLAVQTGWVAHKEQGTGFFHP